MLANTKRVLVVLVTCFLSRDCLAVEDNTGKIAEQSDDTDIAKCELKAKDLEDNNLVASTQGGFFTPQSNVTFTCNNQSFSLLGAPYVLCLQHGNWDRELPKCKYVTCPDLTIMEDLRMQMNLTSPDLVPGTIATYSCKDGYEMPEQDTNVRKCETNGEWSSYEPHCKAKCDPMGLIDGGVVHYNCQMEHCPAQVSCSEGYRLHGDRVYFCLATRIWSPGTIPSCTKIMCEPPPDLVHGILRGNHDDPREPGAIVKYDCDHGYRMTGDGQLRCTKFGKWPTLTTNCIYNVSPEATQNPESVTLTPCGNPESFSNGTFRLYGHTLHFKCNTGFWLDGEVDITCQSNGQWSSHSPTCIPNDPNMWKEVFGSHRDWVGNYVYSNDSYSFHVIITDHSIPTHVSALFVEDQKGGANFELKGYYDNGLVVFQLIHLYVDTDRYPDTNWVARGHLKYSEGAWVYRAVIQSTKKGFSRLEMTPLHKALEHTGIQPTGKVNMTALGLGVAIAIVAILLAALLAAICVRRKGSMSRFGHRALDTSFENPVYEYEHTK